jgi:hypothetical protein
MRTIIYSPAADRVRFLENELGREPTMLQVSRGVKDLVAALIDDPPPRPQILVIDLELLSPAEILHLHSVRDHGWCGTIIALGRVSASLRASLAITAVLPFPLAEDALHDVLAELRFDAQTMRLPVLPG